MDFITMYNLKIMDSQFCDVRMHLESECDLPEMPRKNPLIKIK